MFAAEQQNLVFCTGNKDTTENIAIEWVYLHTNRVHSLTKQTLTHTYSRLTQYCSHTYCSYTHFSEDPLLALMI